MAIELLAPAGNGAAVRAAVQSGADAVYIGGKSFGARRAAQNFTADEIKEQTDYCHLYGVKVHVTVNTLVKQREIGELQTFVKELNDARVDALIVQDLGAAEIIKNTCPDLTLHASTQMSVTTADEVKELARLGFSRVVLARELSRGEIENICRMSPIEIEVFVHGAICQCYSGKCLMSSILGGRSGNRGSCAQPCRLPYELCEGHKSLKNGYLLSPKDMALIDELGTLKRMGVTSLKIEGRLKRAEYVSAVVGVYRKYLDLLEEHGDTKVTKEDMQILTDAFSRSGFTDGYFKNKLGADMMSYASPSGTGDTKYTRDIEERCAENANVRKIGVDITGTLKLGSPLEVNFSDGEGRRVRAVGTLKSEKAVNAPLGADRLKAQLLKLGSTPFLCRDISVTADKGVTLPIKEINAVRRKAAEMLADVRVKREKGRVNDYAVPSCERETPAKIELAAYVTTDEQRRAAEEAGIKVERFRPFSGTLNVCNSLTVDYLSKNGVVTLSPELNLREIEELLRYTNAETEVIAYGRMPLMVMKNCPVNAQGKCQNGKQVYSLRDRKRRVMPIICEGERGKCKAVLLNSVPIYMADKAEDIKRLKINCVRLLFTVENFSQCVKIIDEYKRAFADGEKLDAPPENTFTRGHFYRGVT